MTVGTRIAQAVDVVSNRLQAEWLVEYLEQLEKETSHAVNSKAVGSGE